MQYISEKSRNTPVIKEVDVIVAGGGPAGLSATVSAARGGVDVLLIERNGFLGGVATAVLMPVFIISLDRLSGFSRELVRRLVREGGAWTGPLISFDPEVFKHVAFDIVQESEADLLLYTQVVEPIIEDGVIRGVIVEGKSGRNAILGKRVIDATGDADLASRAGVECVKGREKDGKMRPMTILFRVGGVNIEKLARYVDEHPEQFTKDPNLQVIDLETGVMRVSGFFDLVAEARKKGEIDKDCHYIRLEGVQTDRGITFVNSTRVYGVDGTDLFDLTRAELEAQHQVKQLMGFLKKYIPGCESCFLIDTSSSIGVRETRRIKGRYVLTENDIAEHKNYDDAIATLWRRHVPGQPMHSPDAGEGSQEDGPSRDVIMRLHPFQIPYRCLIPRDVDALLVAGRSISVSHEADAFTRGMFCCMATGQAAGTASALSVKHNVSLEGINPAELQRALVEQGVTIERV